MQDPGSEAFAYAVSFQLIIPDRAILKTDNVPDQCLRLPPSFSAGVPYWLPGEDCEYAQPNIQYRLRAYVKLKSRQDSPLPGALEASKMILILPYSVPMPPTDTSDFPVEFVGSVTNTYRTSFLGYWYAMTLSMQEPDAVTLQSAQKPGSVLAMIHIEIKVPVSAIDPANAKKFPLSLEDLLFKTQPILRAKTFYSTEPFRKMPGQTMLTLRGPMRLRDEVMKLETQDFKASSWQQDLPDGAISLAEFGRPSSTSVRSASVITTGSTDVTKTLSRAELSPMVWSTRLLVAITVPPGLPPTFCSATASRQYSLIVRIRVSGIRINNFVLESPLQIVYSVQEGQKQSSTFQPPDGGLPDYS